MTDHRTDQETIGVLHVTDSLAAGGAERTAVNLANHMPRHRYRMHLCTTRCEGPLSDLLAPDVRRLRLKRRSTFELIPLLRLVRFIRRNDIQILHAHTTALFIAHLASLFPPFPKLIWHDNYGCCTTKERPVWIYRLLTSRVRSVLAVSQTLVDWATRRLRVPPHRVWYVPNFVSDTHSQAACNLPGVAGARIVCVANYRPQKDHLTLIRAMASVVKQVPHAHLLLIGARGEPVDCSNSIQQEINRLNLTANVTLLGQQLGVSAILRACDIGVLSSTSEGLPLSLLEYGLASLPAVATSVGQCGEVLDDGQAGLLVSPGAVEPLASALATLLGSADRRRALGKRLHGRVHSVYAPGPVIEKVCQIYTLALEKAAPVATSKAMNRFNRAAECNH